LVWKIGAIYARGLVEPHALKFLFQIIEMGSFQLGCSHLKYEAGCDHKYSFIPNSALEKIKIKTLRQNYSTLTPLMQKKFKNHC